MLLMLLGCMKSGADDVLSLPQTPYMGNQLRIDGYYHSVYYAPDGDRLFRGYALYRNGIILYLGGGYSSTQELAESIIKDYINNSDYKKVKYNWGVFLLDTNKIAFERWYPSERPHHAFVREGVILNDTTFHITKSYRGSEAWVEDEIYHFRPFSPKPDSSNAYVK